MTAEEQALPERPGRKELQALLAAEGFRPSKTRGQNFLLDANMARAIARDARVGAGDRVLEVGPGCASLSLELAALGAELLCVEIDPRLARIARRLLAPYGQVRLVEADVLSGKHALAPEVDRLLWREGTWHLVANLPYGITGPLLVLLSRRASAPATMTVLVQREVAERITASPGTGAHGPLGLRLAPLYRARTLRAVPPGLFWPRPRVESAVVQLERRAGGGPDREALEAFDRLVDGLFQRRRKALRAALGAALGDRTRAEALLADRGLDPARRAETLGWEELLALSEALRAGPTEPGRGGAREGSGGVAGMGDPA